MLLPVILCMGLVVVAAGCELGNLSPSGRLTIRLAADPLAKNLLPEVDLDVASYDIDGAAAVGGATFLVEGITATTCTVNQLAEGEWTVHAVGRNAAGTIIVESEQTAVTILADEATIVALTCVPKIGAEGTFVLELSWPVDQVAVPDVVGTLTPDSGDPLDLDITLDGATASATLGGLQNGYYTLSLKLFDTSAGEELAWSWNESVLIYHNETTRGVWNLTQDDFEIIESGLVLTLHSDTKLPIEVALAGNRGSLIQDDFMALSATGFPAPDSWQWYLDGDPLEGETTDTIWIGPGLAVGTNHSIVVIGRKGDIAGSAGFRFRVTAGRALTEDDVPDPVLRSIFEGATSKTFAEITTADLLGITNISKSDSALSDLKGIEFCSHLNSLQLARNGITDIAVLPALKELKSLNVKRNPVNDYSPIGQMPWLRNVRVSPSDLSDLDWMTPSVMPNLTTIGVTSHGGLGYSHALAVMMAAYPLAKVEMGISLSNSNFDDFYNTVLYPRRGTIMSLDLLSQAVLTDTKTSRLANLPNLVWLNIGYSPMLHSLDFLAGMTSLSAVVLSGNTGLTDLTPLQTLYDAGGLRLNETYGQDAYVELLDMGTLDLDSGANHDVILYLQGNGVEVVY